MSKSKPYCLSPSEKCNTFCTIWAILVGNRVGHTFKGQDQNLTWPVLSTRFLVNLIQKKLVKAFSSFAAIGDKNFNPIFEFGCCSMYHTLIFEK